jgi:hypothetical protein
MNEGQQQKRKTPAARTTASTGPRKSVTQSVAHPGLDIFGALTYEKKQKKETMAAKAPEKKTNGIVNNSKSKLIVSYSQR